MVYIVDIFEVMFGNKALQVNNRRIIVFKLIQFIIENKPESKTLLDRNQCK